MTGTFESEIARLDHAAQVCAGQACDFKSIVVVNDNGRDMCQHRAAAHRIIRRGADVEFIARRRIELITEVTDQSTQAQRGVGGVTERIVRCIRDAVDECDLDMKQVKGIGIGAPGAVNPDNGRVIFAPNLQWEDVPLKKDLEKELERPVFLENDCNAATLGIYELELKLAGNKPIYALDFAARY